MPDKAPKAEKAKAPEGEKKEDKKEEGKEGKEGEKEGEKGASKEPGAALPGSDKDANGKCVGKDSCPQPPVDFSAPQNGLDGMKENFDKKLRESGGKLAEAVLNPVKCAALTAGAVPAMISGIFDAFAGGIDKVANSFSGATTAAADQGFDGLWAPFKIAHAMIMTKFQDIIQRITLEPGFLDKKEFEGMAIKEVADKVLEKAGWKSDVLSKALETAEFRGIFKPWFQQYIDSLMKVLKIAQPEIDRINAEVSAIIEGMGTNVGDSVGRALTNVIVSALGAMPVVGGIASAINAADQLGTKFVEKCGPLVAKAAGIYVPTMQAIDKQTSHLDCEIDKISHKLDPLFAKLTPKQSGGAKKKIKKTTRRVNYLLKRFTCRRNCKTNYSRRLKRQ
jgi:hypothetical protein